MNKRFHIVSAVIGLVCAAAFALVPFANADAGPAAKRASLSNPGPARNTNATMSKKRMNTSNVNPKDQGCGG